MVNLKEYADGVTDFAAPYLKKAGEYIYIAKDGVIHHYQNGKSLLDKLRGKDSKTLLEKAINVALLVGSVVLLAGSIVMLLTALKRRED